ncbi:hypothetical protein HDU67_003573 [Dinochytrium kinnereticum]|nr:hypothetical protein HDU67_003573 [Dinochytrium kinnereticum]
MASPHQTSPLALAAVVAAASVVSLFTISVLLKSVMEGVDDVPLVVLKLDAIHLVLIGAVVLAAFHPLIGLPWIGNLAGLTQTAPTQPVNIKSTTIHLEQKPSAEPPTTTTTPATDSSPPIPTENPYASLREPLTEAMLQAADIQTHPADGTVWASVLSQGPSPDGFKIEVHRKVGADFCFRVVADMCGTPEEVFDILSDINTRSTWDEICEGGGIVQVLGPDSKVQFMNSKGFWPTAPRDALVVGFVKKLEDGRYLNVTRSVDSAPGFTPRPASVRMQASLAGQIVGPHPDKPGRMCRVVQIMDGDLGG